MKAMLKVLKPSLLKAKSTLIAMKMINLVVSRRRMIKKRLRSSRVVRVKFLKRSPVPRKSKCPKRSYKRPKEEVAEELLPRRQKLLKSLLKRRYKLTGDLRPAWFRQGAEVVVVLERALNWKMQQWLVKVTTANLMMNLLKTPKTKN